MKLRDMKRKVESHNDSPEIACCEPSRDEYPWGLRINLGNDELGKLGIDTSGMSAGDTVAIVAQATVTSISENEYENEAEGKVVSRECSLQIKKLAIEPSAPEKKGTLKELLQSVK